METPENADQLFEEFLSKDKFLVESAYPGISEESLRPILSQKINEVAKDFQKIANSETPTEEQYQEAIKIGLERFPELELGFDSEDRERICLYFKEVMDIVGLQSSQGQINRFYYGFNIN
ncbi:DUF4844 domain-containing protein [Aureisphaera galaxeae]|uniref:DUF4844 domain-containing protein n=1 Tax=Aureisphaera galaxeae TaxID=1538023 RepID=UPI002350C106|nr:DUF4844 domain-containing protein [Aureisphaera galaxeae]MDC8003065.1 DUF4844 domain-containing protein [Aureisphaera galaxeae]